LEEEVVERKESVEQMEEKEPTVRLLRGWSSSWLIISIQLLREDFTVF